MASSIFAAQVLLAREARPVNLARPAPGHGALPNIHWGAPFRHRSLVLGILRCAWIHEMSSVGLWRHVDRQCCHVRFSFVRRHFRAASLFKPPKCCWRFGLHCSPKRSLHYVVFPKTPAVLPDALSDGRDIAWELASMCGRMLGGWLRSALGFLGAASKGGDTRGHNPPFSTQGSIRINRRGAAASLLTLTPNP